ncbi:MAG TPA: hypothetical protein VMZ00_02640 [Sporichthya sp.]|nr:hypothetical protein [Sporichthya sp.]
MRSKTLKSAIAVAGTIGMFVAGTAALPRAARAADSPVESVSQAASLGSDILHLGDVDQVTLSPQLASMLGTKTLDLATVQKMRAAGPSLPGEKTPPVGTTLLWPALDMTKPSVAGIYLKQYTLRGVGNHIEVWVASGSDGVSSGTDFPAGDCRTAAVKGSTDITDTQVKYLINQFDNNMYPKETQAFSTPKDRAGLATLPGLTPAGINFAGDGDNTVTLIDNVRDPNFYDFPTNRSYVAGFFMPLMNEITDRNVMTIDAFDWAHRTGPNPKNEPSDDLCQSRPARPFTYESVFAHEWQHLLQNYIDQGEATWVNEGLSEFAETLVGYADNTHTIDDPASDGAVNCFQGWSIVKGRSNPNPSPCGGPQNSLTMWGDEGEGSEILADYGNAWSFMLFLYDRYGLPILSGLHRDAEAQGLASVQKQLDTIAPGTKVPDVLHDYQVMNLVDRFVDVKGGQVKGIDKSRVVARSLNATLNLANPTASAKPGAAPNGADYVVLRQPKGALPASLAFSGAQTTTASSAPPSEDDPLAAVDKVLAGQDSSGAVANWHVTLVGLDAAKHRALIRSVQGFTTSFTAKDLAAFKAYPLLVAVVSHDDPDDTGSTASEQYADYTLTINGREQAG